ncbi:MAG: enoyl-CoA hydratase/isomerase family protein [Acidaminococcales bacterium]|jgi:2-(1,2-epoxy-1,2-dihydrophenyl)acetyl-CoA isomerase|nr:enoyl-CoA hydratase/isomerase family protein [Acidaminococcales bacterium]
MLLFEQKGRVAIITLNRPNAMNAMNLEIRKEMKELLEKITFDAGIGAVVLQAEGKSFCSGGDIGTMGDNAPGSGRLRLKYLHYFIRSLSLCDKPTIAAVNGYAAGAGFSLALACDFRIAADDAKFVASFMNVGLVPDSGAAYFLPRLVGLAKAKEIIFTPSPINAEKALELGLANKIVPLAELRPQSIKMAEELAKKPAAAIALAKLMLNRSFEMDLEQAFDFEALAQDICFQTPDHLEGINAFKQKRKPEFNQ